MTQADRFTTPPNKKRLYNFAFPAADGMVIVSGMLQHSLEGEGRGAGIPSAMQVF